MSDYEKNYRKYVELSNRDFETFDEVVSATKETCIPLSEDMDPLGNAIIIMGFSGNGKTTFIQNFLVEHPEYKVLSYDEISRRVQGKGDRASYQKGKDNEFGDNLAIAIGQEIEKLTSSGEKIIVDGNLLNLFTRMMLVDTLHEAGYNVNLVDITSQIKKTQASRILDETCRVLRVVPTKENISKIKSSPQYAYFKLYVESFYLDERKRGFFDLQKENGMLDFGVDKYLTLDSTYEEMDSISPRLK